jgi:hypothetical protein
MEYHKGSKNTVPIKFPSSIYFNHRSVRFVRAVWHECLHLNPDCDSWSNLYLSVKFKYFRRGIPFKFKNCKNKSPIQSGDKSLPGNYRPISVLPNLSKIFEKHVATHLYLWDLRAVWHECLHLNPDCDSWSNLYLER